MLKKFGKKTLMTGLGIVLCVAAAYVGNVLGLSDEIVGLVVTIIAGLFGLKMLAHGAADITSMIKGLQKPKDDAGGTGS